MYKKEMPLFLLKFLVIISLFSGIISYLSYYINNPILKVWKEIYIIILFFCIGIMYLPKINIRSLKLSIVFLGATIIIWLHSINSVPFILILYQYKIDFVVPVMFIIAISIFSFNDTETIERYMLNLTKVILICAIINAVFIIYEHYFTESFLNMIRLQYGNWGSSNGVKIITTSRSIRAIGLLGGFVQSGEFMLFSIILLNEYYKKVKFNRAIYLFFMLILIIGLLFSTLKNGILGLFIYFFVKFVQCFFKDKRYKIIVVSLTISVIFVFQAIIANSVIFYDHIKNLFPNIAYNSIYVRVILHKQVIEQLSSLSKILFGNGYGLNGVFGLDKSVYGINPIALDSTYIYLFSNLGLIFVILYLVFLIYSIIIIYVNNDISDYGLKYYLIYLFAVEFFYNNFFASFPINVIVPIYLSYLFVVIRNKHSMLKLR